MPWSNEQVLRQMPGAQIGSFFDTITGQPVAGRLPYGGYGAGTNVGALNTPSSPAPNPFTRSAPTSTSPASIAPAPASNWDPAYGGIPQVPSYTDTTRQALDAFTQNQQTIQSLTDQLNAFNLAQQTRQFEAGFPGYQGAAAQSASNIGSMLRGQVPKDVQDLLQQQAAERGISLGIPGSQMQDYNFLRSLGLTSLGMQQQGEQELTGALARMPRVGLFDPTRYMVTPEQAQQAQWQANLMNAAPIPAAAAAANMAAAQTGLRGGAGAYPGYSYGTPTSPRTTPTTPARTLAPVAPQVPRGVTPVQNFMEAPVYTSAPLPGQIEGYGQGTGEGAPLEYSPVSSMPNLFDFLGQNQAPTDYVSAPNYVEQNQDFYPTDQEAYNLPTDLFDIGG